MPSVQFSVPLVDSIQLLQEAANTLAPVLKLLKDFEGWKCPTATCYDHECYQEAYQSIDKITINSICMLVDFWRWKS